MWLRKVGNQETLFKGMTRDPTEAFGEALGIAVVAASTDLCAAGHRIPRRIRPFNCRSVAHDSPSGTECIPNMVGPGGEQQIRHRY